MEDVQHMALAAMLELHKTGIQIDVQDENKFYESLSRFLEESFDWPDYKNYN